MFSTHGCKPRNPYNMIIQENHVANRACLYYIIIREIHNYFFSTIDFRQDKNYNGRRILLGVASSLAKSVLVVIFIWEILYASEK